MGTVAVFTISTADAVVRGDEPTPIHDGVPPVQAPAPCVDFIWGNVIVPFADLAAPEPAQQPDPGLAEVIRMPVPASLPHLVFPPPVRDPALAG